MAACGVSSFSRSLRWVLRCLRTSFEFALAAVDAEVGETAVHFDLFFTHAAGCAAAAAAAGAAALAVEVAPHPREAGQGVLHAGEFDLQAGFLGVGALGENIENHLLAVDHAEVGEFFPLALLGGGEAVVDDDHVALMGAGEFDDFRGLAGAAEEFLVHLAAARAARLSTTSMPRVFTSSPSSSSRDSASVGLAGIEIKAHQQGALDHFGFLSDFKHPRQT